MEQPPPLNDRIANLERQSHLILFISGVNMIMNALTIFAAFLIAA
jgi:hypothetical protein